MLVHVIIFIPEYLHPKLLLQIILSGLFGDKAQTWTPPISPHSSGLSYKHIQTLGQLIHLHILHMFVSRISTDFHTFHPPPTVSIALQPVLYWTALLICLCALSENKYLSTSCKALEP